MGLILAVKVIASVAPALTVKVPQAGWSTPAVGSTVDGRAEKPEGRRVIVRFRAVVEA